MRPSLKTFELEVYSDIHRRIVWSVIDERWKGVTAKETKTDFNIIFRNILKHDNIYGKLIILASWDLLEFYVEITRKVGNDTKIYVFHWG